MKKLLLAVALATPLPLAAQSGSTLSPYVSTDGSVSGSPVLLGATYSREYGWAALRFGAGIDAATPLGTAPDEGTRQLGVFAADVDALLYAGSPASRTATVIPYALAGVGMQSLRGAAASSFAASWSYGAGLRTPLTSWFTLDGEARYRQPFGESMFTLPEEVGSGLEFRFGASVRMSGRRPRVRVPAAATLARLPSLSTTSAPSGSAAAARFRVAERTLDMADNYLGVHYTWGGNTPEEGFDCSGFVRYVFASEGINLPRVSEDQARAGQALPLDLAVFEPGDLLAFSSRGGAVDHIAIYAGGGKIIHSSSSGDGVRFDDLYSSRGRWFLNHMVAARRVIDGMSGWGFSSR